MWYPKLEMSHSYRSYLIISYYIIDIERFRIVSYRIDRGNLIIAAIIIFQNFIQAVIFTFISVYHSWFQLFITRTIRFPLFPPTLLQFYSIRISFHSLIIPKFKVQDPRSMDQTILYLLSISKKADNNMRFIYNLKRFQDRKSVV